jgi:hypothetical protein
MTYKDDVKKYDYDSRIIERLLKSGELTESEYEAYLNNLEDVSSNATKLDLEEPIFERSHEPPAQPQVTQQAPQWGQPQQQQYLQHPQYGQQQYAQPQQPQYGQPESTYVQPQQPQYTQPEPQQPQYTQPEPQQPQYTQPEPQQPQYTQPEPQQPQYTQPEPQQPQYDGADESDIDSEDEGANEPTRSAFESDEQ